MKARILTAYLNKTSNPEDEVTIALDNSEKEFEIIGVTNSVGKKILILKPLKKKDITVGDSADSDSKKPMDKSTDKTDEPKEVQTTGSTITESGETDGLGNKEQLAGLTNFEEAVKKTAEGFNSLLLKESEAQLENQKEE